MPMIKKGKKIMAAMQKDKKKGVMEGVERMKKAHGNLRKMKKR